MSEVAALPASTPYYPSDRDEAIYEAVMLQARDPVEVGRQFGLATATVRSLAKRVQRAFAARWHELRQRSDRHEIQLRYDRLEAQWQLAMAEWHRSTEHYVNVQTVERPGEQPTRRVTVRAQYGAVRCLNEARKVLAEMQVVMSHLHQLNREERAAERTSPAALPADACPTAAAWEAISNDEAETAARANARDEASVDRAMVSPAGESDAELEEGVASVVEKGTPAEQAAMTPPRRTIAQILAETPPGDEHLALRLFEEYSKLSPEEFEALLTFPTLDALMAAARAPNTTPDAAPEALAEVA